MITLAGEYSRLRLRGLLICEGRDDQEFLGRMLGTIGIPEGLIHIEQYAPKSIDTTAAGGESWIPTYIEGLSLRPGFEQVRAIGFVRDADRAPRSKFESLKHYLREAGLPVPSKHGGFAASVQPLAVSVGAFIMPDGRRRGALEDLYLDAIEHLSQSTGDDALTCVDAFLDCLDPRGGFPATRRKKTRLYAWLSSRTDPATRPGQALTWNIVPSNCPPLQPIRRFLVELAAAARGSEAASSQPPN